MSDETRIDKGIPLPPSPRYQGKHPWSRLEIGDSMLLVDVSDSGARSMAHKQARIHNIKLEVRRVDGGVRVWRTA